VQASSGFDRRDDRVENQPGRALNPWPRGPQRPADARSDALGAATAASRQPTFSGWMPTWPADALGRADADEATSEKNLQRVSYLP
jgi:hypothetical protein